MGFISSQIAARLLILGVSVLASTAVPFVLQDRPRILWVWDRVGPRVVDMAKDKINDRFPSNTDIHHK
jgi:hypothetical protein